MRGLSLGLLAGAVLAIPIGGKAVAQDDICSLRNDALADVGWVAGNSVDHYFWEQVLPYVGVNGIHTVELVAVTCGGTQKGDAEDGFGIYRSGFAEGRSQPFDEMAALKRLQAVRERTAQIKKSMMAGQ